MSRRTRLAIALAAAAVLLAFVVVPVAVQAGGGCHAADGSVHMEATGTTVIRMDVCSFAPTVSTVPGRDDRPLPQHRDERSLRHRPVRDVGERRPLRR